MIHTDYERERERDAIKKGIDREANIEMKRQRQRETEEQQQTKPKKNGRPPAGQSPCPGVKPNCRAYWLLPALVVLPPSFPMRLHTCGPPATPVPPCRAFLLTCFLSFPFPYKGVVVAAAAVCIAWPITAHPLLPTI